MKKIMKRIIPLLLIVALIASACWYIFVYDRETVRDFLMAQARNCAQNGHFEAATWFYDISYEFAGEDENVAIDLARIYKDSGNYTKAEYTLAGAIADGATSELYIALCQTYVEQDKLLDAVNMLDKVADPAIKAELDALRPAAPQADFAPGFYSQYISLNFAHEGGTLYVSTDGEYPSTADTPCVTPVALEGGETKIYAVTVGDNGLVSPLSILSYTVGGVIEEVEFADAYIEELVQSQLMFGEYTTIYSNDLWKITKLTVPAEAIELSDLRHLLYLEELSLTNRQLSDLSFLESMTHLRSLDLSGCAISADLSILKTLPALENLSMQGCSISSLAFLEGAPSLKKLDLSSNAIGNVSVLSSVPTLQSLDLRDNAVSDPAPLSGLTELTELDLAENVLTTISPLASCTKLGTLDVSENKLTDIAAVQNLTALTSFRAEKNQIADCAPLAVCTQLRTLDISNNLIQDITMLSGLSKMTEFDFSYNQAAALPALPADAALVTIDGSYNQLTSLEPLDKLNALNYVYMDYNAEVSKIDFLANNPNMVQINVFGTKVPASQANKCIDHSIIVNYDPT
ncbi:MAG: leucine-rich repeat domain-containing protein [Ruminococcaceae bacterium]|nr:leucine-rich repeat domain-containing protein [Oscillospiraceae bacterium]